VTRWRRLHKLNVIANVSPNKNGKVTCNQATEVAIIVIIGISSSSASTRPVKPP
jgi:hypothetical protein